MKLSTSSEPVLAVLNLVSALAGSGAAASVAAGSGTVPQPVTLSLSAASLVSLAVGWFTRRYVTSSHASLNALSDAARITAEVQRVIAAMQAAEVSTGSHSLADDALAAARQLYPMH